MSVIVCCMNQFDINAKISFYNSFVEEPISFYVPQNNVVNALVDLTKHYNTNYIKFFGDSYLMQLCVEELKELNENYEIEVN